MWFFKNINHLKGSRAYIQYAWTISGDEFVWDFRRRSSTYWKVMDSRTTEERKPTNKILWGKGQKPKNKTEKRKIATNFVGLQILSNQWDRNRAGRPLRYGGFDEFVGKTTEDIHGLPTRSRGPGRGEGGEGRQGLRLHLPVGVSGPRAACEGVWVYW